MDLLQFYGAAGAGGLVVETTFWLSSRPVGMTQASEAPGIALYTNPSSLHYPITEEHCLTGHMKDGVGSVGRGDKSRVKKKGGESRCGNCGEVTQNTHIMCVLLLCI